MTTPSFSDFVMNTMFLHRGARPIRGRHLLPAIILVGHLFASGTLAGGEPPADSAGHRGAGSVGSTVILLGTGTPYPDPDRQGPATAVTVGERVFLFDAGPGVMRQMKAAGLPINGVEALFITHLHSDHTLGYPDLMLTSWVMRRTKPFPAYGPTGLRRMTDHIIAAWQEDIEVRTEGLEREVPGGYRVDVREIDAARSGRSVYDSAGVRVTAIPVPHGNWREAYGYRIDTPDRSIVIAGDTRYSEAIEKAAEGVDVLVHELYPESRVAPEDRPGGEYWPQYLREFHISDVELGRLAARARPKLLLLTHVIWSGAGEEEVISGIRKGGYAGPIEVGRDLGRY